MLVGMPQPGCTEEVLCPSWPGVIAFECRAGRGKASAPEAGRAGQAAYNTSCRDARGREAGDARAQPRPAPPAPPSWPAIFTQFHSPPNAFETV